MSKSIEQTHIIWYIFLSLIKHSNVARSVLFYDLKVLLVKICIEASQISLYKNKDHFLMR